eukprot:TRINITY_DN28094_c0_g1_i1.p1 TRINITY_DN28094_c0_g1~~TRINITY_DN28094_c0_g1_i1.p1  ORF type:complete len:331 (-),score=68.93 TRINITY_DN28094_c0_g1_i1:46-1038(-)
MRQCLRRNLFSITRRSTSCVSKSSAPLRFYSGEATSTQASSPISTTITVNSNSNELLGTVEQYEKHYIVSTNVPPEQWQKDVTVKPTTESKGDEDVEATSPTPTFLQEFKQQLAQSDVNTKTTRLSNYYDSSSTGTDVIVFPDKIKFTNLQIENIPELIQATKNTLNKETTDEPTDLDKEQPQSTETDLKHKHHDEITILICSHLNRDKNCGQKGPEIYQAAKEWLEEHKIESKSVNLLKTSHLGGHKHSGVCVVYPFGDWFGKVDKHSISNILEVYLKNKLSSSGEPNLGASKEVLKMWRGRMGMSKQAQDKLYKQFETPLYVADLSVF